MLSQAEKTRLIGIVANLSYFTDGDIRGRRVFIGEIAGLRRFSGINLSGEPNLVAADLVGRLERFGQLPEKPTYHSLGALLNAMLSLPELSHEDTVFIASLIVRYSLIADPLYLETLREQYNIVEDSIRNIPNDLATPRLNFSKQVDSPEFAVQIGDQEALERIINSEDNFLDIHLLYGALYCSKAVGRIEIPEGTEIGTGFLVAPNLLLTNQHVLKNQDYLEEAVVRFGYMRDASGVDFFGKVFQIKPDFYYSSPSEQLDYALVRLKEKPLEEITANNDDLKTKSIIELVLMGKHRSYLTLVPKQIIDHSRVNIIQHPNGKPLKVVMTQNYVVNITDQRIQYVADTMDGSSGSPVFNQAWQAIALHHSGRPYPPESLSELTKKIWKGRFRVNEGIPIRAILKDFKNKGIDRFLPREG